MRVSLKIVGAQGQGVISIGDILAKAFKRSGYCVFGYREYNSLIKGGHSTYQIDISDALIRSSEETVNMVISLNHHGFEYNLGDLKDGGAIIHDTARWEFSKEHQKLIKAKKIQVISLPVSQIIARLNTKPILGNVVFSAFAWAACGGDTAILKDLVGERFAKKKDLLETNMKAIDEGIAALKDHNIRIQMPESDPKWSKQLLLTGSQAMGLGLVRAGVRLYAGYPMTPSSPLLSYISEIQNETGMVIKQAEDEITAAQMISGANFMGTRAVTATSGGGFDLMTETISLNGIIENPTVFVLAQRPGPATGLPTWTAQGDLMLAAFGGHGEFARCVMSVSESADSFALMNDAFTIAEKFQTPVIVLTDKHVAEALYTQPAYEGDVVIERGRLIVKPAELKKLKSADRYDPAAKDGVSPRWLPGAEAETFCAQGDEHNGEGSVDEGSENARLQMVKRMKKLEAMKNDLPEPELFGASGDLDLLIVGWGSSKGTILDTMAAMPDKKIGYLHYTYLWPLHTDKLKKLMQKAKRVVLVEGNNTAQLGDLIRMQSSINIEEKILKYNGRPFFLNELVSHLS
jgi:2-oxoglutarate/2-oxoacid ferredoxin oxidoreductase subunit alpha